MQWSGAIGDMALCIHDYVRRGLARRRRTSVIRSASSSDMGDFRERTEVRRCRQEIIRDLDSLEPVIWRLFEVEGGGEISLATLDKYRKHGEPLDMALKTVSDAGHLDRRRARREVSTRSTAVFRISGRLVFALSRTDRADAGGTRRPRRSLPRPARQSHRPHRVAGDERAEKNRKAGRLDADLLAQRIEPALYSRTAATAKGALALLEQAGKSRPGSRARMRGLPPPRWSIPRPMFRTRRCG